MYCRAAPQAMHLHTGKGQYCIELGIYCVEVCSHKQQLHMPARILQHGCRPAHGILAVQLKRLHGMASVVLHGCSNARASLDSLCTGNCQQALCPKATASPSNQLPASRHLSFVLCNHGHLIQGELCCAAAWTSQQAHLLSEIQRPSTSIFGHRDSTAAACSSLESGSTFVAVVS